MQTAVIKYRQHHSSLLLLGSQLLARSRIDSLPPTSRDVERPEIENGPDAVLDQHGRQREDENLHRAKR